MKRNLRVSAFTVMLLIFLTGSIQESVAITPAETGSSGGGTERSENNSFAMTIGSSLEKFAATLSQAISPQASDSNAARLANNNVSNKVCRISIVYVTSFVPVINWTFRDSRLIPILTSMAVTEQIQTQICS